MGVGTVRSEIDDLTLVHSEHAVGASSSQQSQMGIRTKAPVSDQDVAQLKDRVKKLDVSHLVGSQGSRERAQQ
jgi:hypothetical protein